MSMFELYLLTRLDNIQFMAIVVWLISLAAAPAFWIWSKDTKDRQTRTFAVIASGIFLITSGILILIPSEKDAAIIIAGSWATNNEEMKKLPDNVAKTLNRFLEENLKKDTKED